MKTAAKQMELLYDKAKTYTENSIELYTLKSIEITSDIVSSIISKLALVFAFSIFILFVNIAISLLIGNLLGAYYLGFLIVSSFYIVITILIYFFNDRLIKVPIANLVIVKLQKYRKKVL